MFKKWQAVPYPRSRYTPLHLALELGYPIEDMVTLAITGTECIANRRTSFLIYIDIQCHPHPHPSHCYPTINCPASAAIYSNSVQQTLDVYDLNVNSTPIKGMQVACFPLEGFLFFDTHLNVILIHHVCNFLHRIHRSLLHLILQKKKSILCQYDNECYDQ